MKSIKNIFALLFALHALAPIASACDEKRCYYATACTIDFCLYTLDATVGAIKVENAAHASGDTYLMKDEGAEGNTTNGFVDEGSCYSETLTATETTAARILLNIEDQGTKAWADKCISIATIARTPADNGSAAFSYPTVDTAYVSGDSSAADNLETMLDGTGGQTLSLGKIVVAATTGDAINISTAAGNGDGIDVSGNGTGAGIKTTGGITGNGISAVGGATSGHGIGTTIVSGYGLNGTINGNITGNLSGSIGSLGAGAISSSTFAAGAIDATALAADSIGSSELSTAAANEIASANWSNATRQLTGTQVFDNTGTWTGNLTGSVGSVTGAVGSVTGSVGSVSGAVGSVTGNVNGSVLGSVGSLGSGSITSATFGAGAIDANALAADSIGSSELAASAASEVATAVGSGITLGAGAISASTFQAGAIDAAAIAADAIGSSELAASAATEVASAVGSGITLGAGAITSATFASGAIDANAIATDAIGSAELATTATSEITGATLNSPASSYNAPGSIGEAINDGVGGGGGGASDYISTGTAQSATLTTVRLASSENYATNVLADNASIIIDSAGTGAGQVRCIKANNAISDTVTLTSYFNVPVTGTIVYRVVATPNCNPGKWHQSQ